MTPHEKSLILIKTFGYNLRQVAEVLDVKSQTVDKKIKQFKYNKFSESDFEKLLLHFQTKIYRESKVLEKFKCS